MSKCVRPSSPFAHRFPLNDAGGPDPHRGNYDYTPFKKGLKYSDMSEPTKAKLTALAKEYVYNLNTQFADAW